MTDDRATVVLFLPHEFVAMCEADDISPMKVLNGFVADLCGLDGSHGSDERDLAQRYYDRCTRIESDRFAKFRRQRHGGDPSS